ncbi:alkaline phosphatase D family protein [Actinomadura chokoriensis]|uniref:alkaline phosphatase D family protein n=1 Tax=Actinomadura chokoriensis TaxID=454156 RepID=UPI0031F7FD7D
MASLTYGWVGGTTAASARFTVCTAGAAQVRVAVSATPDMAGAVRSTPQAPDGRGLSKHEVAGLSAATAYHWAVEADGAALPDTGRFRTLPMPGTRADFGFCFGGDRTQHSDHVVYDRIRGMDPLQFLFLGDLHYDDADTADQSAYDLRHRTALSTPRYGRLIREVATVHTWDNHDFTGNGGWSGSLGAQAVRRSLLDHGTFYPPAGDQLYYTWVVGRCRFIMLDTRGGRTRPTDPDGAGKSLLGRAQKQWYLDLLRKAPEPVLFVAESFPHRGGTADRWLDYRSEFNEINAFVNANGLGAKMVLMSADMHAVAADDGRSSKIGAMELVAAPLDQTSNGGGGTWQIGPIAPAAGAGQFGHVQVTDAGGTITVTFTGYDHDGTVLATLAKEFPVADQRPLPRTTLRARTDDRWFDAPVRAGTESPGGTELTAARPWVWQGEGWS